MSLVYKFYFINPTKKFECLFYIISNDHGNKEIFCKAELICNGLNITNVFNSLHKFVHTNFCKKWSELENDLVISYGDYPKSDPNTIFITEQGVQLLINMSNFSNNHLTDQYQIWYNHHLMEIKIEKFTWERCEKEKQLIEKNKILTIELLELKLKNKNIMIKMKEDANAEILKAKTVAFDEIKIYMNQLSSTKINLAQANEALSKSSFLICNMGEEKKKFEQTIAELQNKCTTYQNQLISLNHNNPQKLSPHNLYGLLGKDPKIFPTSPHPRPTYYFVCYQYQNNNRSHFKLIYNTRTNIQKWAALNKKNSYLHLYVEIFRNESPEPYDIWCWIKALFPEVFYGIKQTDMEIEYLNQAELLEKYRSQLDPHVPFSWSDQLKFNSEEDAILRSLTPHDKTCLQTIEMLERVSNMLNIKNYHQ